MQLNLLLFFPTSSALYSYLQDLEREYGWNLDDLDVHCPNLEVLKLPDGFQYREL